MAVTADLVYFLLPLLHQSTLWLSANERAEEQHLHRLVNLNKNEEVVQGEGLLHQDMTFIWFGPRKPRSWMGQDLKLKSRRLFQNVLPLPV